MTDRVPGAPGQYTMSVAASEAQKILTGEDVTVTLTRDDQPLVEGTPYNKQSVLPDDLAEKICPEVTDPTPADAFRGLIVKIDNTISPVNYVDNSDFTQFIAQAGIGNKHGNQAYAGDRWILDSGTVTGEDNENGNGYSNIQLNGTIRQIIANPLAVGSVFVDMVTGTAEAVYENGAVTITSNGGVIRNVLLCEGQYTEVNKPRYQPKSYGVELAECQRHFIRLYAGNIDQSKPFGVGITSYTKGLFYFLIPLPVKMRTIPALDAHGEYGYVYGAGTFSHVSNVTVTNMTENGISCVANLEVATLSSFYGGAYTTEILDLVADML